MLNDLEIYIIAPQGDEKSSVVVVAENRRDAIIKALRSTEIAELAQIGTPMQVSNITEYFKKQGYVITISKESMFH